MRKAFSGRSHRDHRDGQAPVAEVVLADPANRPSQPVSQLHHRSPRGAPGQITLVLLDTSGSLLSRGAMASSKGAIVELCRRAYIQRQALELVGFSGEQVMTLQVARKPPRDVIPMLETIGAGGGTPLRKALLHAATRLRQMARQRSGESRRLIIFTDARSRDNLENIALDADVHVVDTEQTAVRIGKARQLARTLNAGYQHIADSRLV